MFPIFSILYFSVPEVLFWIVKSYSVRETNNKFLVGNFCSRNSCYIPAHLVLAHTFLPLCTRKSSSVSESPALYQQFLLSTKISCSLKKVLKCTENFGLLLKSPDSVWEIPFLYQNFLFCRTKKFLCEGDQFCVKKPFFCITKSCSV